ncbi:BlaI/MecI/CopY family transcriptional regulator [Chryseobacterium sp.]|uniref:BlaI/MecI/CopY family transcriptional regulator n=1 Tax=Chryseobacterium sp. TaxID=1871047 RepID=UPI00388EC48E
MKINHLTSAEENLMKLFWDLNSFYLKDVMEKHAEPKPHQNTVSTYLKILVEKGYLSTEKEGRIFRYSVVLPIEEYKRFLLNELSRNFFDHSGIEMVEFLLNEKLITQENLKGFINISIDDLPTKAKVSKQNSIVEEILAPKKIKKSKESKEKDKTGDKKKKKKKN